MMHVPIAFRNPIAIVEPMHRTALPLMEMVAAQSYDAVNSAHFMAASPRHYETNWPYRAVAHDGALGYAISFAAVDVIEFALAKSAHIPRAEIETWQAAQSIHGIQQTGTAR